MVYHWAGPAASASQQTGPRAGLGALPLPRASEEPVREGTEFWEPAAARGVSGFSYCSEGREFGDRAIEWGSWRHQV